MSDANESSLYREKMEKRLEHSEKRGWGRKWWKHWH